MTVETVVDAADVQAEELDVIEETPLEDIDPKVAQSNKVALEAIARQDQICREKQAEVDRTKAEAKIAKEELEEADRQLHAIIRENQQPNLFNQPVEHEGDDAWRDVPISKLKMPATINEKLSEHEPMILTLGHLADFMAKPRAQLTDITGIGPGKAETIEFHLGKYWEAHPEQRPPLKSDESEGEDSPEAHADAA